MKGWRDIDQRSENEYLGIFIDEKNAGSDAKRQDCLSHGWLEIGLRGNHRSESNARQKGGR